MKKSENRYEKYAREHGISIEDARLFFKQNSKAYKEYWTSRGYSDEEATLELSKRNKRTIAYWTSRGYSEEEARKVLRKRNPQYMDYWIERGYSEEQAILEVRKLDSRFKEFWLKKGYSEEQACERASYNGKKRNKSCKEYWIEKGVEEEEAEKIASVSGERFKSAHAVYSKSQNTNCKEYWIARGFSEEEAKEKAILSNRSKTRNITFETRSAASKKARLSIGVERLEEIRKKQSETMVAKQKTHSPIFKEFWLARGYSEEEAKKQVFYTKYSSDEKLSRASKIELKFFEELEKYLNIQIIKQKWVRIDDMNFCQDGRYGNVVFEFNGTKFHLDPRFYSFENINPKGVSFRDIRERDNEKIKKYSKKKYNVIVVWEYDYLNFKESLFENIKRILEDEKANKEGNYWDSASFFHKCE